MQHDSRPVASPAAAKYLQLHLADHIGPIRVANLLRHFGSVDDVLSAPLTALERVPQIGPETARAIVAARAPDRARQEIDHAATLGVRILCLTDPEYPTALKSIPDPPVCLYVRGCLRVEDRAAVAVVGTRRCTQYGRDQGRRFAALLSGAGFTIVSGLARGIDGSAHHGALEAGGRTLAVLGQGIDAIYPPEHDSLARRVSESGALISETPLTSHPDAGNFPRRNRVIVGLSAGVLVVEAPRRSGALISARLAADYDREVFVLPGRVDVPQAAGTNQLIRDGATPVTCLEDVLDELAAVQRRVAPADRVGRPPRPAAPQMDLSADERVVLDALGTAERSMDALCSSCDIPVPRIAAALTQLQIVGAVRQRAGGRFRRADIGRAAPATHRPIGDPASG